STTAFMAAKLGMSLIFTFTSKGTISKRRNDRAGMTAMTSGIIWETVGIIKEVFLEEGARVAKAAKPPPTKSTRTKAQRRVLWLVIHWKASGFQRGRRRRAG